VNEGWTRWHQIFNLDGSRKVGERKSYNQCHAEYLARIRAQNPALAALWGTADVADGTQRRGATDPAAEAAEYAAEQQAPDKDDMKEQKDYG